MLGTAASSFLWKPGHGPDPIALQRMAQAFPKPKTPMGEAWFMAPGRKMYRELLGDLDALTDEQLKRPFEEMATGPSCFGQRDEWTEWYHYLLPRLLMRSWEPYIYHPVEVLFTSFMAQHPDPTGRVPYPEFRTDALAAVGQYIMAPRFWPGDRLAVPECFNKWEGPNGVCGWYRAEGLLSASLFFCVKYLPQNLVAPWFESVVAISNKYWKAQIITWLIGAHALLSDEISQPSELPEHGAFDVAWDWSHTLRGNYSAPPIQLIPFLPTENRNAVLEVARCLETDEFFEDLLTDPDMETIAAETAGMPKRFREFYNNA